MIDSIPEIDAEAKAIYERLRSECPNRFTLKLVINGVLELLNSDPGILRETALIERPKTKATVTLDN